MSIDLHIHSENSDGTDSPEVIIQKAIDLQLEAISITDHEYLTRLPSNDEIEIINGVEVSVSWEELEESNAYAGLHLLLYFIKKDSPVEIFLEEIRRLKEIRNLEIIDNLQNESLDIDKSELNNFKTRVPGRPHIASILKNKIYKEHITKFFYDNCKKYKIYNFKNKLNLSKINLSVDTANDLRKIKKISNNLNKDFKWQTIYRRYIAL